MRDAYAADISDAFKFSFLRALAGDDKRLGIGWYYAPGSDNHRDGRRREWLEEPTWRQLDPELHAGLSALPERSVAALERAPIWPKGALFHREPLPRYGREAWGKRMRDALEGADLVFLDPDNGVGDDPEKHAFLSEVQQLRRPGRAVVFITFPGRTKHHTLLQRRHDQLGGEAFTLRITAFPTVAPSIRWFTVVDPDAKLMARTQAYAATLSSVPRVSARIDHGSCVEAIDGD
jgi:hypothetical protein